MLSDLILSAFALGLFFRHRYTHKLWSLFYLFMAASALVGGIYHGFTHIGEGFRFLSWSLLSASLVFAQLAAYQNIGAIYLKTLIVIKSVIFLYFSIHTANFGFMVMDTAISMLGLIALGNLLVLRSMSPLISYGIMISIAAALVVSLKWSLHPLQLTYNDIGHYISILSLIVMSKGIRQDAFQESLRTKSIKNYNT